LYYQTYDPMGSAVLSTIVAAVPIGVLLYFIALHPHQDQDGMRHLGVSAPYAALYGVFAAFAVSCLVFKMPVASAVSAFALGSRSGFLGIIWIVLAAMLLYTMTLTAGKRAHALGPIFRTVFWHSIAGAAVVGAIAVLQADVFTGAIPALPIGK
jgi:lactate permease